MGRRVNCDGGSPECGEGLWRLAGGLANGILALGGLGLVALAGPAQAQATFCDRTPAVRSSILEQISGITACEDVTEDHLNGITELALNSRGLSSLQGNDFAGLSSLESLNLKSNFLSSLDAEIFAGLSSLKLLYLHDNHLSSLDADIFAGLANLQQLYLYRNDLNSLPAGIFAGLANLERLILNNNSLSSLPAGIFADLANLEELFLYLNHLSSLDAEIFAGLSSLKLLHLSDNSLNSLPAGIFAGLANLEKLVLSNNSLSSLDANIFAGLANLQQLSLDNNSLNSLGANIFAGLANLQWLYLYDNSLSSLDAEIFAGLANLQQLYLYRNDLNSLPAGIFAGLANLQWLFLNSNSLNSLPEEGIFAGLANLQRLYLHNNGLECLPRSMPWSRVNGRAAGGNLILLPMLPDCFGVSLGVMPTEVEEDNGGESITVTATLSAGARPTSVATEVAISVAAGTASEGADFAPVIPFTMTIPSGSESATRTFTLTTMADAEAETGGETVLVSGTSTESYWSVDHRRVTRIVDASDATVTIKDALVTVQATMLMLTVGEGSSGFYTLVLNTDPTVTVTITPGSSDSGVLTVSPASLTFTATNWNTAQTVSVTAMEDADGADETVTVSHSVSGIATITAAAAVTVSVTDDDDPGVSVTPTSVSTAEGGTATYTVRLSTLPAGAVTITPGSSDSGAVSVSPASLTFTPSNWNTARTVSVTGVEDGDARAETVTVSHSVSGYDSVTVADAVTVSVTDSDTAGVRVEPTSLRPVEGGTATYSMTLRTLPAGVVTITPGSSDSGAVSVAPASLTFTPSNWDTPRTVSVTGVQDVDARAETVTVSHSVSGYDSVTAAAAVTVSVTDDDTAGGSVDTVQPGVSVQATTLTVREASSGVYTLLLDTLPPGAVTITPGSGNSGAVSVSPASLTFTPSNWDTARTVSVTGVEDDDANNETVTISHSVSGYGAVTAAAAVTVSVTDDDTPGVKVVEPASVSAIEGETATYTVRLNTLPAGAVTITPSSGDSGAVSVSPASLTFTAANWDTPQAVSVTGVEDADTDDETVTISHSVSGYDSVTAAAAVTVSVTDDDTPGVKVVEPASVSAIEGETATYTVRLNTLPAGAVTITPSSGDSGAVSVSPASLTFTAANWDTPQAVSVTGVEDADTDDETVTISHSVSGYDSVTAAAAVTVTVTDDEVPGVSVTPISVGTAEGETATYAVRLVTLPSGTVTITPSSGDSGALSVSPVGLTFTPSNWDTPQAVSVTGVEDADTDAETVTISHSVSGYDSVTAAPAVMVSVTDNDTAGGSVDTVQPGVSVQATTLTVREASSGVYTLLLDTPPPGAVTITPSSSDSGAVSVSSASLTFTPSNWDTPQAVSVTGVQDGDTDDETVTISHGVSGYDAVTVAAAVTVTVTDDDTTQDDNDEARAAKEEAEAVLDEVVLPEVMQQLTARTTEVITSRLNTIASGSLGDPLTLSLEEVLADTIAALHGEREHLKNGSLEWRQAVSGRDFAFPLSGLNLTQGESASAQEHPFSSLAVWGGADYSSYGNTIESTDVDGSGFSGVIGMDLQPTPRLVSGLALTSSRWGLDYETDAPTKGTYEIGITMLHPYLNWLATDQLSLWATFGYGRGAVDHNPEGDAATTRTDGLTSWAGGVRFEVLPGADPLTGEGSPFALALKVDGAASSFLETQVQLARLAAEVSRSFTVESGLLTTALDLGWSIRSVSGQEDPDDLQRRIADKKDGGGAELAGSLNWRNVDGSVSATVDTRVLLGGGDRREWGMGGQLRFAPSRRAGEGPSLTLQPSFGMTDTRLDELWSLSGNSDPAIGNDLPGGRLDAQLAYGFRHGNALLTPYTELTWEEAASIYGAGLRYHRNASLELDLKGTHRNRANGNTENRFSLDVRSRL